ncbi:hypothetical protein RN001_015350 [Aquatica leii]|uniref:Uncharacterized protein n=1 Tax=Aquatica leii TaxID=1421715 RepID=A0AAN7P3A2_9COLE|nr:hypothetical protein RN001_015350 [Aquatica leii]
MEAKQYYFLNDNELKLQYKLLDLLPKIDLNITPNPVVCTSYNPSCWIFYQKSIYISHRTQLFVTDV